MSRHLRYPSSHSRESSLQGDIRSLPGTENPFQDLHLTTKTTTTTSSHQRLTVPSSYQAAKSRPRQESYPPTDLAAQYLHPVYEPSQYSRPSSSEKLVNPRYISTTSAFGAVDPDSVGFSIDPRSLDFEVQDIPDSSLLTRPDMSNYNFPSDPLAGSYRGANSYDQYFTYSNADNSQRRTSSPSSYSASSNLGSAQYGRTASVSSTQGSYLGMSSPPSAYNSIPSYQTGYGIDHVNPQSVCNPSHAPALPGMLDSTPLGYRSRQMSSASVASVSPERIKVLETRSKPQCWEHGCNGRQFSTFSNLLRHQREKSGTATKSYCPRCNAEFTRTTARNGHMQHEKCKPRSSEER